MNVRHKNYGYTLVEVMIVIFILGAISIAASVRMTSAINKGRNMEAESMLYAIFTAQQDYFRENGAYTNVEANLALTIPAMKNFTLVGLDTGTTRNCVSGAYDVLAEVRSLNAPAYDLWIDVEGQLHCEIANDCTVTACTKMGYQP